MCEYLNYYYGWDYFVIVVNVYYQEHRKKWGFVNKAFLENINLCSLEKKVEYQRRATIWYEILNTFILEWILNFYLVS